MVAKGHHFAGVELAAVIDADTALALPDFRAEERTFQLITQLAGRSGRDAPGPGARPDLPARRAPDRLRGPPRRPRASSPRSSSAARRSATRPSATSSGSSSPGAEPAPVRAALDGDRRRACPRPSCSARRRSFASAAATAPSSIAKTDRPRAVATPRRAPCSPPPLRRCAAPASRPSSTSTRSRSSSHGSPVTLDASGDVRWTRSKRTRPRGRSLRQIGL